MSKIQFLDKKHWLFHKKGMIRIPPGAVAIVKLFKKKKARGTAIPLENFVLSSRYAKPIDDTLYGRITID